MGTRYRAFMTEPGTDTQAAHGRVGLLWRVWIYLTDPTVPRFERRMRAWLVGAAIGLPLGIVGLFFGWE